MKNNLKLLIYTALMTAFVFITTSIIKIPIPFTNGYIHAGDMCIFIAGILLGPLYGGFAAGVGSALADFLGGYAHWVIPTLIIKTLMGMIIGYFSRPNTNTKPLVVGVMLIWITSLLGFFYTLVNTNIENLASHIEDAPSIANALEVVASLKTQLLVVSIGIPFMVFVLWFFKHHIKVSYNQLIGMIVSGIWMVLGYYVAAGIMYGSFIAPIFSIPWNIVQFGLGAVLAYMVIAALDKANINANTFEKKNK